MPDLKKNIEPIENSLEKILKLEGKSYLSKLDNKKKLGLIAQEVREVLPELVIEDDLLSVNYQGILPLLINAFKEQQKELLEQNEELLEIIKKQQKKE